MKKTLALILTALLLVPSFTACSESKNEETKAPETQAVSDAANTEADTAETRIPLGLPADLTYDGAEITVLGWQTFEDIEFDGEELNGEVVHDAVMDRNTAVEDRLDIKLTFLEEGGRYGDSSWLSLVSNSNIAFDGAYDIVAGHSNNMGTLTYSSQLLNLLDYDYLDFTMPWWRAALTDKAIIQDKLFFATGDISPSAIGRSQGVFFNSQMLDVYQLEDPYNLVVSGEWTLDKMIEMTQGTYTDVNANGESDEGDQFGFVIDAVQVQALGLSAGIISMESDETGSLIVSPGYNSERTVSLIEKWASFLHSSTDTSFIKILDDTTIFREGRALFYGFPLAIISSELRSLEFDVGFVPYPKFDEQQEDYVVCTSNAYSLWAMPLGVKNPEMSSAVLETLAYEGNIQITPAIFETAYKVKYNTTESQLQSEVFDIVRENLTFDIGRIMNASFMNIFNMVPDSIIQNRGNFSSMFSSSQRAINRTITKWMDQLAEQ